MGAVAPRATNPRIVDLGAEVDSQWAGILSTMALTERETQGRLIRGFSESWWFKRSNKKEVRDGAQCGGQG